MHRAITLISLAVLTGHCQATPSTLSCPDAWSPTSERSRIDRLARNIVTRNSAHVLKLSLAGKSIEFQDKPPFDGPLSGTTYAFCAQNDGFVLLRMGEDSVSTGLLIREADGNITPGGETILFSPDKRAYFSTEQPDGLDGKRWKIFSVEGRESWIGFSFIPRNDDPDLMLATLDRPRWTASGEFIAHATCIGKPELQWSVKLTRTKGSALWQWSPIRRCE